MYRNGLVIGKFMPLHTGHMYLIEEAAKQCSKLTILVGSLDNEPIDGHRRYEWVKYTYPQHNVVHNVEDNFPDWFIPGYWYKWVEYAKGNLPKIDAVFTSEDYGDPLSKALGCVHIKVDQLRTHVPISATKIRTNPIEFWDYLAPMARPYFVKRILLLGGESCGKSTMAKYLADYYQTVHVPEFARDYMKANGNAFGPKEADDIMLGQMKLEERLALDANRLLFCDTDNLVTREYADEYGFAPDEYMKRIANEKRYDLYLFLDNDLPWEDDGMRDREDRRNEVKELFIRALTSRRIPYTMVRGIGQERFDNAVKIVDEYLKTVS